MKLKLAIRDLFWLTLVVALALGWWVERRRAAALQSKVSELKVLARQETFVQNHVVPFAVGNPAALTQMIQSAISPEEWIDRGGVASMSYVPGSQSLVVSADGRIQVRVAEFLQKLERFDKKAKEYGQSWVDYERTVSVR